MVSIRQKTKEEMAQRRADYEREIKAKTAAMAKQTELWSAINLFVARNGGWLTSPPGNSVRIETREGSELPDKLYDAGYDLVPAGSNERIWGGKILPVNVFTFRIPTVK